MNDSTSIDFTPATSAIEEMVDALKDWVGDNAAVLFGVAGAFIIFWVLRVGIRIIQAYFKHLRDDSIDLI